MYKYKVLSEAPSAEDGLAHGAHSRIADSIYSLIKGSKKAFSIGLEGRWGVGKSTILRFLSEKFSGNNDVFFIFDAWGHDNDPLRKIFLKKLLNSMKGCDKISFYENEIELSKVGKINTNSSLTKLGIVVLLATILTPVATSILASIDYSNITLYWREGSKPLYQLWLALAFLMPVAILAMRLVKRFAGGDKKGLEIIGGIQEREVSIEEVVGDKTSIEFERLFSEMVDAYEQQFPDASIVIAIDNLDRIDKKSMERIWATLQIFLQSNNARVGGNGGVFFIIAYDKDVILSSLPGNGIKTKEEDVLRKNIQIRVDVPDLMISNWMAYLSDCVNEAFLCWDHTDRDIDKDIVRSVYADHISSTSINPTPRCIRAYVNQVGFVSRTWGGRIPMLAIARYCALLVSGEKDNLIDLISSSSKGNDSPSWLGDEDVMTQMAALYFNVDKGNARELIITPIVDAAFRWGNEDVESKLDRLLDVVKFYRAAFPVVWGRMKNNVMPTSSSTHEHLVHSCAIIYKAFSTDEWLLADEVSLLRKAWEESSTDWNFNRCEYLPTMRIMVEMLDYDQDFAKWVIRQFELSFGIDKNIVSGKRTDIFEQAMGFSKWGECQGLYYVPCFVIYEMNVLVELIRNFPGAVHKYVKCDLSILAKFGENPFIEISKVDIFGELEEIIIPLLNKSPDSDIWCEVVRIMGQAAVRDPCLEVIGCMFRLTSTILDSVDDGVRKIIVKIILRGDEFMSLRLNDINRMPSYHFFVDSIARYDAELKKEYISEYGEKC